MRNTRDQMVLVDQYGDTGPAALDNYELRFGNWTAEAGKVYRLVGLAASHSGAVTALPMPPQGSLSLWHRKPGKASMIAGLDLVASNGEIVAALNDPPDFASGLAFPVRPNWGLSVIFSAAAYPALWQATVTLDVYDA